jgi:hypothetical protein
MRTPNDRKPIAFRQLCAIARELLTQSPTINDAEWKEQIKRRVIALEFTYPEPLDLLETAMTAVQRALEQTLGRRPVELPTPPAAPMKPQQDDPPWPKGRPPAGWTLVAKLVKSMHVAASEPHFRALPSASREVLAVSEHEALNVFWAEMRAGSDRLATLHAFAEIAIVRPADWDPQAIRAKADQHRLTADQCFGCFSGDRKRAWHHIIQIQHGGSNTPRNRIALCGPCHSEIHPWLTQQPRRLPGWTSVGDLLPLAFTTLERASKRAG